MMSPPIREPISLGTTDDVVRVRQSVRRWMIEHRFSLVDQTKMITAASELARNALIYGGGGAAIVSVLHEGLRTGIRVEVEDHGPGIADIAQAMTDGFTTGGGLGLGLGGSKRLVNDFDLWSEPGRGTRVTITRWK